MVLRALLFLGLVACSGEGTSSPDAASSVDAAAPREVTTVTKSLLVGELAESTFVSAQGDHARITLTAPVAGLDWNIHHHNGGGTQTVKEELGVMSASYDLAPSTAGEWFLLIRNRHTAPLAVDVKIELFGSMTWSNWL